MFGRSSRTGKADERNTLGVDGVDVVIGTSSFLREHSHGKDIQWILKVKAARLRFVCAVLTTGLPL